MYFNINDRVKVKLTDYGREIYYKWFDDFNKKVGKIVITPHYPKEDENGFFEAAMWSIMEVFGNHIHMGGNLPFSTTIVFHDEDLKKEQPQAFEYTKYTSDLIDILEIK